MRRALIIDSKQWQDLAANVPSVDANILAKRRELTSLDRTVTAMSQLESKQPEANSPFDPSVQLQVPAGPSFLSPGRQIIGLKSRRISTEEDLRVVEDELVRIKTLNGFGNEVASLLTTDLDPLEALNKALVRAQTMRKAAVLIPEQIAADTAEATLLSIKAVYVDSNTNPMPPQIDPAGIRFSRSLLFGSMIGIVLWAWVLWFLRAIESRGGMDSVAENLLPSLARRRQTEPAN